MFLNDGKGEGRALWCEGFPPAPSPASQFVMMFNEMLLSCAERASGYKSKFKNLKREKKKRNSGDSHGEERPCCFVERVRELRGGTAEGQKWTWHHWGELRCWGEPEQEQTLQHLIALLVLVLKAPLHFHSSNLPVLLCSHSFPCVSFPATSVPATCPLCVLGAAWGSRSPAPASLHREFLGARGYFAAVANC